MLVTSSQKTCSSTPIATNPQPAFAMLLLFTVLPKKSSTKPKAMQIAGGLLARARALVYRSINETDKKERIESYLRFLNSLTPSTSHTNSKPCSMSFEASPTVFAVALKYSSEL